MYIYVYMYIYIYIYICYIMQVYRCGTRGSNLCLTEKYIIARANQNNLLNKKTKSISKCRHARYDTF